MVDRHHRTAPPVCAGGRLLVPGDNRLFCVDAFNGAPLWERDLPDSRRVVALRDSSHLVAGEQSVYMAAGGRCLVLDAATGRTRREISLPAEDRPAKEPSAWGYLARAENLLLGTSVPAGAIRREQSHHMTVSETHWDRVAVVLGSVLFACGEQSGGPPREGSSIRRSRSATAGSTTSRLPLPPRPIPAAGLPLVPEASSGCTCHFPVQCSFALAPWPEDSGPESGQ